MLRRVWQAEPPEGLAFRWLARRGAAGLTGWDIGQEPAPGWPADAILLHLAGTTGANSPESNPLLVPPLLGACRAFPLRHLVFLSTAAVSAPGPVAAKESDLPRPANPYGAAKYRAEELLAASDLPLTILRLGNLAGADALLAPRAPGAAIRLDPVPGDDPRGPLRSWIGPLSFARSLAAVLSLLAKGQALPPLMNLAQSPPLGMAELLRASGLDWSWGEPNPAVVPVATLDCSLVASVLPMSPARPEQIIEEVRAFRALPEGSHT